MGWCRAARGSNPRAARARTLEEWVALADRRLDDGVRPSNRGKVEVAPQRIEDCDAHERAGDDRDEAVERDEVRLDEQRHHEGHEDRRERQRERAPADPVEDREREQRHDQVGQDELRDQRQVHEEPGVVAERPRRVRRLAESRAAGLDPVDDLVGLEADERRVHELGHAAAVEQQKEQRRRGADGDVDPIALQGATGVGAQEISPFLKHH